jgi:hypothetical protein
MEAVAHRCGASVDRVRKGTEMTRITIICEECERRHTLERTVGETATIWIICHGCELPIQAIFEVPDKVVAAGPSRSFADTWASTLDLSSSHTARPSSSPPAGG